MYFDYFLYGCESYDGTTSTTRSSSRPKAKTRFPRLDSPKMKLQELVESNGPLEDIAGMYCMMLIEFL